MTASPEPAAAAARTRSSRAWTARRAVQVGQQGEVVRGAGRVEQRPQRRRGVGRRPAQDRRGRVRRPEPRARRLQQGLLLGEALPGQGPLQHGLRGLLGLGDVGLVERVHAQRGAGRGGGDLPAQEGGAEPRRRRQVHQPARAVRVGDGPAEPGLEVGRDGEGAVGAQQAGGPEPLAVHRQDAAPVLARALGDQLLDPGAEGRPARPEGQGELVRAGQRRRAHAGAEGHAGAARRVAPRLVQLARRAGQQRFEVGADQGRGHQAEQRQRRVAPAHVGRVEEDAAVAAPGGQAFQRAARVGHGHEGLAGRVPARGARPLEEVPLEGRDLDGAARLRGDHAQRARRVVRRGHRPHRGRRGVVEHGQLEEARADAEHAPHHLGGEARATHAQQDRVGEARGAHLAGEGLQGGDLAAHRRRQAEPAQAAGGHRLVRGLGAPQRRVAAPQPGGEGGLLRAVPAGGHA